MRVVLLIVLALLGLVGVVAMAASQLGDGVSKKPVYFAGPSWTYLRELSPEEERQLHEHMAHGSCELPDGVEFAGALNGAYVSGSTFSPWRDAEITFEENAEDLISAKLLINDELRSTATIENGGIQVLGDRSIATFRTRMLTWFPRNLKIRATDSRGEEKTVIHEYRK